MSATMYVQIRINGIDQGCNPVMRGEDLPAHCNGLPGVWYPCDAYYTMVEDFAFDRGTMGEDMPAMIEEFVFYQLNEGGEEHGREGYDAAGGNDFFGSADIVSIEWDLLTEADVDKLYSTPAPLPEDYQI